MPNNDSTNLSNLELFCNKNPLYLSLRFEKALEDLKMSKY